MSRLLTTVHNCPYASEGRCPLRVSRQRRATTWFRTTPEDRGAGALWRALSSVSCDLEGAAAYVTLVEPVPSMPHMFHCYRCPPLKAYTLRASDVAAGQVDDLPAWQIFACLVGK